ncbi:hypothetical protein N9R54_05915 [Pelobium sp.]|nr:hypothetical protein [Pelobium sp.]MDA9555756.1 hypothetical protein [Pelobium sp.]
MNPIEDRIWDYIDGLCSLEEQEAIAQLIANDPVYRDKYAELMALQESFNLIELDEPSMAFTNKVMDKIALQNKPLSQKALIDKRIIYGISALFGLMLLTCLIILLKEINWSSSIALPQNLRFDYNQISQKTYLSPATKSVLMYSFLMFDVIAGLMILDRYLRKRLA